MKLQLPKREHRRSALEYVLICAVAGLFAFGIWAIRVGNAPGKTVPTAATKSQTYEPGTVDEIDALAEQSMQDELAAESKADEIESAQNTAAEGAADTVGGIFDENSF